MARSNYIYLLYDASTATLLGAFTVKHEMATAARRWRTQNGRTSQCYRVPDNDSQHPSALVVIEEKP